MERREITPSASQLAFAPLHKLAMGVACGTAAGLVMLLVTVVTLLREPMPGLDLGLVSQFFTGYTVSWPGALIGTLWAGFTGFVVGWFLAFTRNLTLAALLFVIRTRAELEQTRDFLDHI